MTKTLPFIHHINKYDKNIVTLDGCTIAILWHGLDNQGRHVEHIIHSQEYDNTDIARRCYRRIATSEGLKYKLFCIRRKAKRST